MPTTLSVDENSPAGTHAGDIGVFAQGYSPITLFTISGTNSDWFKADKNGRVALTEKAKLNYESKNSFALKVKAASDYGESAIVDLTIKVNNVPDVPPVIQGATFYVDENSATGTFVGRLNIDDDGSPIISAGLSGTGAENFKVDNNGTIVVAEGAKLDYESKYNYYLYAKAANAFGESNAAGVYIYLNNLPDTPPVLQNTHFSINRKTPVNKTIGNVRVGSVIHCDITDYVLDDESVFGVRANGEVYTKAAVTEGSSYAMSVYAKSLCGDSATIALTVDTQNRFIGKIGDGVERYSAVTLSSDETKAFLTGDYGLKIIDISDPFSPVLISQIATYAYSVVLSSDNKKAFVATADYGIGLKIIDVSDPYSPALIGQIVGDIYRIALLSDNKKAFVADLGGYLKIIDVSDPYIPALIGQISRGSRSIAISSDDSKAFAANYYGPLMIIDISNPANPVLIGKIKSEVYGIALSSDDTKVFVAASSDLKIIDVSDPFNPALIGRISAGGYTRGIALSSDDTKAFVAASSDLKIIDVSDPFNPTLVGQIGIGNYIGNVVLSSDNTKAFVFDSFNNIKIIDIEDFTKSDK
jgi:hypothetical protein